MMQLSLIARLLLAGVFAVAGAAKLADPAGSRKTLVDFGVPELDLAEIAAATVERAGAKANPRQPSAAEVEQLLHNIY